MQALEPYPPAGDVNLMGSEAEYEDAKQRKEELGDELYKGIVSTAWVAEWLRCLTAGKVSEVRSLLNFLVLRKKV